MPSTGIEPVAFPMSRERATAAPTGLKIYTAYNRKKILRSDRLPQAAAPTN